MADVNGYRSKFGNIVPSTNTTVEHDFAQIHIPGVTFHAGRIYIPASDLSSADSVRAQIDSMGVEIATAIRTVLTCRPDYLVLGMSAPTFWGGREGSEKFLEKITGYAEGLGVTTGAIACRAALDTLGLHNIAVVTPYQPIADEQVVNYFEDYGYHVKRLQGLRCKTMTSIAEVTETQLIEAMKEIDGPDVDGIVQVGTDLSMVRLADEAERWFGKPVIAINAATAWHALRARGIDDQVSGLGSLLRDH